MSPRARIGFSGATLFVAGALAAPAVGHAAVRTELLVVGNNHAFNSDASPESAESALPVLRYADDDAAAFYELLSEGAAHGHLLTVMDAETQVRFPALAAASHPPTLAEVREAVGDIESRIEVNRRRGDQTVVYLFFSGHGAIRDGRGPALALLDGDITHDFLYDEILSKLRADFIHLFVDACHAEGVVRPRDSEARAVAVSPQEAGAFLVQTTLDRFPQVGAIVAASSDAQAHEWDQLGHGIFTSELLSALRGAADVNRDHKIEYSEVFAFLSAANRGVRDLRARLSVVAKPPQQDQHVAIVDLSQVAIRRSARLVGVVAADRRVEVEDGDGRLVATLRGEPGFVVDLSVPAGTTYVRMDNREAKVESREGQSIPFDWLDFRPPRHRARGAMEDAVRRGLYANKFGRGYYTGFIDQSPEFASVAFAGADEGVVATAAASNAIEPVTAGSMRFDLVAGLGLAGTVTDTLNRSAQLRLGLRPDGRRGPFYLLDLARASGANVGEWQGLAWAGWQWGRRYGRTAGWLSAAGGIGMAVQTAADATARWSPLLAAGPGIGAKVAITGRIGLWIDGQLAVAAYRKSGGFGVELRPSLLTGASLGF